MRVRPLHNGGHNFVEHRGGAVFRQDLPRPTNAISICHVLRSSHPARTSLQGARFDDVRQICVQREHTGDQVIRCITHQAALLSDVSNSGGSSTMTSPAARLPLYRSQWIKHHGELVFRALVNIKALIVNRT